jgi:hypothetical protein
VRWLHLTFLLLGGALFTWLVASVGLEALWREAARLGWGVIVIVAVEGIADFLHTCAWRRCFRGDLRPRALRLWWPHLAGAAINYVTPTATLGGEVVRGTLAPRDVPPAEVTASLAINKLTATLADTLVALAGVGVLLFLAPVSSEWRMAVGGGTALVLVGVAVFVVLQRRGQLAGLLGRRQGLALLLGAERARRVFRAAEDVDSRIATFHASSAGDLLRSVLLHFLGVGGIGALQLFIFLRMVGAPSDPVTVISILVVARAIDLVSFFVPARLGAQEGGRMFAMSLVGIDASLGLLFSLVLRLEQVAWTGVGFGAYAAMLWQHKRETRVVEAMR